MSNRQCTASQRILRLRLQQPLTQPKEHPTTLRARCEKIKIAVHKYSDGNADFDATLQIPMQYAGAGFTPQYTGTTPAYPGQYTQALQKPKAQYYSPIFLSSRAHPISPVPTLLLTNRQKVITNHSVQQELFTLS